MTGSAVHTNQLLGWLPLMGFCVRTSISYSGWLPFMGLLCHSWVLSGATCLLVCDLSLVSAWHTIIFWSADRGGNIFSFRRRFITARPKCISRNPTRSGSSSSMAQLGNLWFQPDCGAIINLLVCSTTLVSIWHAIIFWSANLGGFESSLFLQHEHLVKYCISRDASRIIEENQNLISFSESLSSLKTIFIIVFDMFQFNHIRILFHFSSYTSFVRSLTEFLRREFSLFSRIEEAFDWSNQDFFLCQ